MANPWFRLYSEMANDPKVLVLTEALRWRYVALLCLHCNEQYENTPDDEISLALRITEEDWIETKETLIKRRLLNEDGSIRGWENRQYISDIQDPTAAERQKRYREKKRNERNDTVTSRPPESESDTDTDTEVNTKPKRAPRFDALAHLVSIGVPADLSSDWIKLRKTKRAEVTKTAIEGIAIEALKAGLSLDAALRECCARGWSGFKADWLLAPQARASPFNTIHDQRAATIAALTGMNRHERTDERDITGEAVRVA